MTRQLLRIGVAIMTTLLGLVVLWQFRMAVVYVLVSLTFAAALRPLSTRLAGRGLLARVAWLLLYALGLASIAFLLFVSLDQTIQEIQQLAQTLSVQDAWQLPDWLAGSTFQQALATRLPPPSQLFDAVTGERGQLVLPVLLNFTQGLGGLLSAGIIVFFLSVYWSISQVHFERLWLSLLPSGQRKQARDIWRTVEPDIGAYVRGELIHSLLAGLLLGLGYWLIGSPYPALLALLGAFACLIPVVGAALVVIPVLLVGLLSSVQLSLLTVLYTLLVLIALATWVKPRLFHREWDNSILTVVLLIVLASAFGMIGVIIAPPVSVVCQILWSRLVSRRAVAGSAAQISDLKARHALLWDTIRAMEEPPPALVASSMQSLAQLIEKAEPVLQVGLPAPDALTHASNPSLPPRSPKP